MIAEINGKEFEVFGHEWFWPTLPNWEKGTFEVVNLFANPESIFIDAGAWNGVVSMAASQLYKYVWAYEPDVEAFKLLTENIIQNGLRNVQLTNKGFGASFGKCHLYGGTGDSMSSIHPRSEGEKPSKTIYLEPLSKVIETAYELAQKVFIKMDVEGAETVVLPECRESLKKHKPVLFLSLHPMWFPDPDNNLDTIKDILFGECGYTCKLDDLTEVQESDFTSLVNNGTHTFLFL